MGNRISKHSTLEAKTKPKRHFWLFSSCYKLQFEEEEKAINGNNHASELELSKKSNYIGAQYARESKPNEGLEQLTESPERVNRMLNQVMPTLSPNITEKYKILGLCGWGGTGIVTKAIQDKTNRKVAIKIISKHNYPESNLTTTSNSQPTPIEVEILKTVKHTNIVEFIEFINTDSYYMIVEEFVDYAGAYMWENEIYRPREAIMRNELGLVIPERSSRGTLRDFLNAYANTTGRYLPPSIIHHLFVQLIHAYKAIREKGFVYLDFKPENMMIDSMMQVKLIDFSMSQKALKSPVPITEAPYSPEKPGYQIELFCDYGTLSHSPPEALEGKGYFGVQGDMWALGVVLYIICTYKIPFEKPIDAMNGNYNKLSISHLPGNLQDLIERLLIVDHVHRITLEQLLENSWIIHK